MARMYQVGLNCPDCKKPLYRTTLNQRVWCKECREFKDSIYSKDNEKDKWWK